MLNKNIFYYLLFSIFIISCNSNVDYSEIIEINSPSPEYIYYDNTNILFSIKSNQDIDYEWVSSIDGIIGIGNNFFKCLSEGEHLIKIYKDKAFILSININVCKSDKKFFSLVNEGSYKSRRTDFGLLSLNNGNSFVSVNDNVNIKKNIMTFKI